MLQRTRVALKEGQDCCYNATNLSAKRRIGFLKEISDIPNVKSNLILVAPPLEKVLEQNSKRDRVVPESVIHRMLKQFEMPHESEGWYKIKVVGAVMKFDVLTKELVKAKNIPHDNPHHSASIGNHMLLAHTYLKEHMGISSCNSLVPSAALYHDIGKPYCKVFHNAKGEPSEIAHYYNHENVGAYMYISHSYGNLMDIEIANLIAHHMDFFKGEAYMKKIKARFPDKFIKDLELLHEADLAAH